MLKHDPITKTLAILAAIIVVYLSTFASGQTVLLYPAILFLLGIVGQLYYKNKQDIPEEPNPDKKDLTMNVIVGVICFSLVGIVIDQVPSSLIGWDQLLYSVLMAVSETLFFQGFILSWLLDRYGSSSGAVTGATAVAMCCHLARYGISSNVLYVGLGFLVLNYLAVKSGILAVPMLIHIINNVRACI